MRRYTSNWQHDGQECSTSPAVRRGYRPFVPLDDRTRDRHSEPCTSNIFCTTSNKFFEYMLLLTLTKPGPAVAHQHDDIPFFLIRGDFDRTPSRRVVRRIL